MKIYFRYVLVIIIGFVVYSCSGSGTTHTGQSIKNTKWMLESFYGERIDSMYLTSGNEISLNLNDSNEMNGKAPCNHYFSTYTASGQTIMFGAIGATRMACPNLDMEQKYFSFLSNVTRYSTANNRLTLYSTLDGVTTTAMFRKMY